MPVMNGFEFVEEFEKFPTEVKNNYLIVILSIISSERDHIDLRRKFTYDKVDSVIEKPLTTEKLFSVLSRLRSAWQKNFQESSFWRSKNSSWSFDTSSFSFISFSSAFSRYFS